MIIVFIWLFISVLVTTAFVYFNSKEELVELGAITAFFLWPAFAFVLLIMLPFVFLVWAIKRIKNES